MKVCLTLPRQLVLCCWLIAGLAGVPAWAEKPESPGHGKSDKHDKSARHGAQRGESGAEVRMGAYFGDAQRDAARAYYGSQARGGKCPPGLAKKNNGCMPPGQAKKWSVGKRLPSEVIFHTVPQEVVVKIGLPPPGYKYVRVAADILLIAIGTSMVIDAIEDLAKL